MNTCMCGNVRECGVRGGEGMTGRVCDGRYEWVV